MEWKCNVSDGGVGEAFLRAGSICPVGAECGQVHSRGQVPSISAAYGATGIPIHAFNP